MPKGAALSARLDWSGWIIPLQALFPEHDLVRDLGLQGQAVAKRIGG